LSLFDDILQGLPVNSLLREQVGQLNAQKAAVETELAIAKDDNRQLHAENANLKKQIGELTHTDIGEAALNLLKLIVRLSDHVEPYEAYVLPESGLSTERFHYHMHNLVEAEYISDRVSQVDYGTLYQLTHKGRQFLINRGDL
jgi:regulator of replication initiation timing